MLNCESIHECKICLLYNFLVPYSLHHSLTHLISLCFYSHSLRSSLSNSATSHSSLISVIFVFILKSDL